MDEDRIDILPEIQGSVHTAKTFPLDDGGLCNVGHWVF